MIVSIVMTIKYQSHLYVIK